MLTLKFDSCDADDINKFDQFKNDFRDIYAILFYISDRLSGYNIYVLHAPDMKIVYKLDLMKFMKTKGHEYIKFVKHIYKHSGLVIIGREIDVEHKDEKFIASSKYSDVMPFDHEAFANYYKLRNGTEKFGPVNDKNRIERLDILGGIEKGFNKAKGKAEDLLNKGKDEIEKMANSVVEKMGEFLSPITSFFSNIGDFVDDVKKFFETVKNFFDDTINYVKHIPTYINCVKNDINYKVEFFRRNRAAILAYVVMAIVIFMLVIYLVYMIFIVVIPNKMGIQAAIFSPIVYLANRFDKAQQQSASTISNAITTGQTAQTQQAQQWQQAQQQWQQQQAQQWQDWQRNQAAYQNSQPV